MNHQLGANQNYYVFIMGSEQGPFDLTGLRSMVTTGQIAADTLVRTDVEGAIGFQAKDVPGLFSTKEWMVALLLAVFLGLFGIDRMYLGQVGLGIAKLAVCIITCTIGGVIWQLVDIILIAMRKVTDGNGLPLR